MNGSITTQKKMSKSNNAYILVGPTAVGKTDVAHVLARRTSAPILSADSMLVYQGMDIGTAKPSPAELEEFRYSGVDIVAPNEDFNLARYLEHARKAIGANEGYSPLLVGGTGLYVKALIRGLDDAGQPDSELREHAETLLAEEGLAALQAFVAATAPENFEQLKDDQNPRRLVRALESHNAQERTWQDKPNPAIAGLRMERELLWKRIEKRVDRMYAQGLLDEVRGLIKRCDLSPTARQAIGYKEAIAVIEGRMDWTTAREKICTRTRRLAKSQMNWFRNQENVVWVDIEPDTDPGNIADRVEDIWREHGRTELRL